MKKIGFVLSVILCLIFLSTTAFARETFEKAKGQTVIVPITYTEGPAFSILMEQICWDLYPPLPPPGCPFPPCPPPLPPWCPPPPDPCPICPEGEFVVQQYFASRLGIRNLDLDNSLTVTSIRMFDPYGNPVAIFDSVVGGYLPRILGPGESMTQGVTPGAFKPHGGLPLYPRDSGRPFLIVEWESDVRIHAPKIGASTLGVRTGHPIEQGVWSTGPHIITQDYRDGIVIEEKWGMGKRH